MAKKNFTTVAQYAIQTLAMISVVTTNSYATWFMHAIALGGCSKIDTDEMPWTFGAVGAMLIGITLNGY